VAESVCPGEAGSETKSGWLGIALFLGLQKKLHINFHFLNSVPPNKEEKIIDLVNLGASDARIISILDNTSQVMVRHAPLKSAGSAYHDAATRRDSITSPIQLSRFLL